MHVFYIQSYEYTVLYMTSKFEAIANFNKCKLKVETMGLKNDLIWTSRHRKRYIKKYIKGM